MSSSLEERRLIDSSATTFKLYGRETELATLQTVLDRACSKSSSEGVEYVFVGGSSGTGKSALLEQAFGKSNRCCIFGTGKFEKQTQRGQEKVPVSSPGNNSNSNTPFAPLFNCLQEICNAIVRENDETDTCNSQKMMPLITTEKFQENDMASLSQFIPGVSIVLARGADAVAMAQKNEDGKGTKKEDKNNDFLGAPDGLDRLKYLLRMFFQYIASSLNTANKYIVICLDDIQWADESAIDILQCVLTDHTLKNNVLFAATYRDIEVMDDNLHPVMVWIKSLEEKRQSVTRLTLTNLTQQSVVQLLQDLLRLEGDDVTVLAEQLYGRTHGNALYLLQMLELLQAEQLLTYDPMLFRWTWDVAAIQRKTSVTDNVASVVGLRLQRLSPQARTCLKLAGCIGFRFKRSVLSMANQAIAQQNYESGVLAGDGAEISHSCNAEECEKVLVHSTDMKACVEALVQEGLLEQVLDSNSGDVDDSLKFVHDKIYEAAVNSFATVDASELHYNIGKTLWQKCSGDGSNSNDGLSIDDIYTLFVCVDQSILGKQWIVDYTEKVAIAQLCCSAAKQASKLHAFMPAADYCRAGISFLNRPSLPESWTNHYQLTLELHTLLAEMSVYCGQDNGIEALVKTIISNAGQVEDSMRASNVLQMHLISQRKYDQARDNALNLLRDLGEPISLKTLDKLWNERRFTAATKRLRSLSDEGILDLPRMRDAQKEWAVHVMADLINPRFSNPEQLSKSLIARILSVTFDHGIAEYSILGFIAIAAYLRESDMLLSSRLTRLVVKLADKMGPSGQARLVSNSLVLMILNLHWVEPMSKYCESFLSFFEKAMRCGCPHVAFQFVTGYCISYFYSGLTLGPLIVDSEKFLKLMHEYSQNSCIINFLPCYQALLNIAGATTSIDDTAKATAIRSELGWTNREGEQAQWSYLLQLYFYCEEFDKATEAFEKLVDVDMGLLRFSVVCHVRIFFFALVCSHQYKATGKRKFRQQAEKFISMVRHWVVKQRAINMAHKLQILQAERATWNDKHCGGKRTDEANDDRVASLFQEAIVASLRAGFRNDGALAASLASRCMVDHLLKQEFFDRSLKLYSEWGAEGILNHLEKHSRMCQRTSLDEIRNYGKSTGGKAFRSRERFDNAVSKEHKHIDQSVMFKAGEA